jgi:hypothetical protein
MLNKMDSQLLQEVLEHANFCNETAEKFHGRNDLLTKIKEYLLGNLNVPFLIYGDSGNYEYICIYLSTTNINNKS